MHGIRKQTQKHLKLKLTQKKSLIKIHQNIKEPQATAKHPKTSKIHEKAHTPKKNQKNN